LAIKGDYAEIHFNLGELYLSVHEKGLALEKYKILKTLGYEKAERLFNLIFR